MAKFCGKCGSKLEESTGLCPKCDANQLKKQEHAVKKEKQAALTVGQKIRRYFLKFFLFAVLLLMIAGGTAFSLAYFDICEVPIVSDIMYAYGIKSRQDNTPVLAGDIDELEQVNIGEETRSRCQVLEIIEASESNQTTSEAETAALFAERGFDASEVTTTYSMDGTFFNEQGIDDSSVTRHPLYYALYVSPDNYYWMVYCCNGEFSAYPISYVLSDKATCEVLVSENEYLMSYDSDTNCFYKIIPNEGEGIIEEVSRIDANALDILASGELGIS